MKLLEAFQPVYYGPKKKNSKNDINRLGSPGRLSSDKEKDKNREQPLHLLETRHREGVRHLLRHCKECPEEKKSGSATESVRKKPRKSFSTSLALKVLNNSIEKIAADLIQDDLTTVTDTWSSCKQIITQG